MDLETYSRHIQDNQDAVWAICLSIVRRPELAEEVAQDTFVRGWSRLGQLRDPSRFGSWS